MKKNLLMILLLCLLTGCAGDGAEAPQVTPTPTPEQAVMAEKDIYADYIASVEAQSDAIKKSLTEDALTQLDMNMKSKELYDLWDGALNYLWGELKNTLPEDEFAALTDEQLQWIADKEKRVEEVGKDYGGGSIYALIVNDEAARITQERVYELYGLLCVGEYTKESAAAPRDLYSEVLANYYDIIARPDGERVFAEGEFGVFEAARALGDGALNTIGYVFTDLNGDGTEELLMGVFDAADGAYVKNELYAGYTLAGDTPVLLFEGSARSAYSLMEVGRLFYYGSGGAMYSIFGEAAVNDDNGVEWVDYYFTYETDEAMTEIGFYHNTDGKWDPAVSERLDTDEDAFFALRDVYAGRTVILEDTKFAELGE